jgi:uncharacterized membrane protein YkvA (DUF1232 family)
MDEAMAAAEALPAAGQPANGADAFPRDEFGALLRRLPAYARLAWALARDPRLSRLRRAAVLAAAGYVVSPIDVVPGIIPIAGQLDDLLIALAAIRLALDGLRPEVRAERLAAAGLTQADLEVDIRATGAIARWMGRSAIRVGRQVATTAIDVGGQVGGRLVGAGRDFWQRRPRR